MLEFLEWSVKFFIAALIVICVISLVFAIISMMADVAAYFGKRLSKGAESKKKEVR